MFRRINHHFLHCPYHTNIKRIGYHSVFQFASTSDSSSLKDRQNANQATLDYANLLQYVRPEMALRIQQLIDHENYLSSLSSQIKEKQEYIEKLQATETHKQPQLHNQKMNKVIVDELTASSNASSDTAEAEPLVDEPGLDLRELSSIKSWNATFFGPNPLESFHDFQLDKHLIKAIGDMGINMPSHIQQLGIPQVLAGNHCVIGAETGTGKTIAYLLPILQRLLSDKTVTESQFDPISKFIADEVGEHRSPKISDHKYHPFEFDAEKKFPVCLIIQPNEQLCVQVQKVLNEILDRYYDAMYLEQRDNPHFYKLKSMSLYGRALLPKNNESMPDILITTPTALQSNIHKKHSENRHRAFLSKIKYIVLDEADHLTRAKSRHQLIYLFRSLKELRSQIDRNPLKYKLLIPRYLREETYGSTPSLLYRELNKIGKPQMVFVGATIPTTGKRTVADIIRDWLDKAVWIRTPGLHQVCNHIAQEFRYVPRGMELDILHQVLINLARDHLYKIMFESDDDLLYDRDKQSLKTHEYDTGRHKKRKRRLKRPKNAGTLEWERKQKQLHILVFVNSKKFTRECYSKLLQNGWLNTRCIHSQLHREERKQRLQDFEHSVPCDHSMLSHKVVHKNVLINNAINEQQQSSDDTVDTVDGEATINVEAEYQEAVNNVHILVTSDYANRGIDFKNVDVIINAEFPTHAIIYLHRCGRTGRGDRKETGKVISFFNEYDLDLAWHIQMSLVNQYKKTLQSISTNIEEMKSEQQKEPDWKRVGTSSVRLDDCFGLDEEKLSSTLKYGVGGTQSHGDYHRMSLPRDYEKRLDLTRIDLAEMDERLVQHIVQYANMQRWINNDDDKQEEQYGKRKEIETEDEELGNKQRKTSDVDKLKSLIEQKKKQKQKLKVPWPYRLEFANQ